MSAAFARGRVVAGRYRIEGPIGRGAVGEVYEARHLALDIPVAVKWVPGAFADEELKGRAMIEARTAALLTSPHVARTLDFGFEDGAAFITMELLKGETLEHRLAARGRLSPRETFAVIRDVALGLADAHANGILHRDLKPQNIFLCQGETGELAKILDFGVALFAQVERRFTRVGLTIGTPAYMSPEQATAFRPVDARSDYWQLAIVTFECLTGKLPYRDAADLGGLVAQMPRVADACRDHPYLPPAFARWFAQATTVDPDGRHDEADFVAALGDALGVADDADAAPARTGRGALVALGIAIALLAATLAAIVAFLVVPRLGASAPTTPSGTSSAPVIFGTGVEVNGRPLVVPPAEPARTSDAGVAATATSSPIPRAPTSSVRPPRDRGDRWGIDPPTR